MDHLTDGMRKAIEKREIAFVQILNDAKQPELASLYNEIITLRHAVDVLSTSTFDLVRPEKNGVTIFQAKIPQTNKPHLAEQNDKGFVLRTAVRNQIIQFAGKRFRTRDMYEKLHGKYPEYVNESKKASVSATLANLTTMGEVKKIVDGQRKIWFQAV